MTSPNDSSAIARLAALLSLIALGACTETEVILPGETGTETPPPVIAAPDADNDGLSDEEEASLGTSPIMADTDGDGFNDKEEITNGGTHPLIADVPSFSIDVTGSPTIDITSTYETDTEITESFSASLAQGQESSYSRSDSTSTTNTTEKSDRVYAEVSVECSFPGCGGSAKAGAETTSTATNTQEKSTSVTSTSAASSRQEYGRYAGNTQGARIVEEGGTLKATIKITNTSARSFRIRSIDVIAKNHADGGRRLETIDELLLAPDGGRDLVPGAAIEQALTGKGTSVTKLKELMRNPSGLLFTVGSVSIDNVSGGDPDRDFADISQAVFNQTARVVIDFGDQDGGRSGTVETYLVATNVARDEVTQQPLGITMREVMENILEIPYTVATKELLDANGNETGEQQEVLSSVRNVASQSVAEGVWYVYSDSATLDAANANFGDIVLTDDNYINLVYLADADGDRLFNREEQLHGTNMRSADTDEDGLSDLEEVKEGWIARSGFNDYRVYSDPLSADADDDGVFDADERANQTDPNLVDTDGDGEDDLVDTDPTGGSSGVSFALKLTGPGNRVTLTGSVTSSSDLDGVLVDWGDGSPMQPLASFNNIDASHLYAVKGNYQVTVTADRPIGTDPTKQFSVALLAPTQSQIGGMTFADGWTEAVDRRRVADINSDGRIDIVGFGPGGVWVALADGAGGFAAAENVLPDFDPSVDANFAQHIHLLANVGGGPEPEIVVFHDDAVLVSLNLGGEFQEPEPWVEAYGVNDGLDVLTHPRVLGDVNRDGFDDIIGFLADGVYVSRSFGVGFDSPARDKTDYGTAHGWTNNHPRMMGDANGDGYPDLFGFGATETRVTLNSLSPDVDGTGIFGGTDYGVARYVDTHKYIAANHIRLAVNLTGDDGTDDVIAFANSVVVANRLLPDTGFESTGYTVSSEFAYYDGWRIIEHDRYVTDVTGDGRPEVIGFKDNEVLYSLNTGDNGIFERETDWPGAAALFGNDWDGVANPRFTGDVNGDGIADLIGIANDAVIVEFSALIEAL